MRFRENQPVLVVDVDHMSTHSYHPSGYTTTQNRKVQPLGSVNSEVDLFPKSASMQGFYNSHSVRPQSSHFLKDRAKRNHVAQLNFSGMHNPQGKATNS